MAAQEADLGPLTGGDLIKHQVHALIINEFVGDIFFIGGKAGLHALGILIGLIRAFLRGGVILGNPYTTILGAVINNHRAAGDQQPVAIGKPLHGGGRHILIPKNPNITADGLLSLIEGSFVEPYIVIVSLALALFSLQVLHDLSIWRPDGLPVVVFPMQIADRSTIDHLTGLGIGIPAIHQVTASIAGNAGHRQVFIGGAGDKLIIELRKIRLLWLWVRLRLRLWLRQNIDVPLRTTGRQQHQCRRQQTKHPFSVFSHFLFPPCCMLYCLLLQWFQLRYNSANVIDTPATGDYNMLCYSKRAWRVSHETVLRGTHRRSRYRR